MKWLKKVSSTPLTSIARVIDSLDESTNNRTNAPSIHAVNEAINNNWLTIYPIGSIYMSVNNVDPSLVFGGTWQQIKDKFLLASGDIYDSGETGGSATNTLETSQLPSHTHSYTKATSVGDHQLTIAEMPNHDHIITNYEGKAVASGSGTTVAQVALTPITTTLATGGDGVHNHPLNTGTDNTGSAGSAAAINNMPPYLAVNVWVRTA